MLSIITHLPLLLAGLITLPILTKISSLFPLLRATPHVHLTLPASELTGISFYYIFIFLASRTLLRWLRPPKRFTHVEGETYSFPTVSVSLPLRVTPDDVKKYRAATGVADPLAKPHLGMMLVGLSVPAALLRLSKRGCPVGAMGDVNVRNRYELAPGAEERVRAALGKELALRAKLEEMVIKVKRGWQYTIALEVTDPDKHVLSRQRVTMLSFAKHKVPPPPPTSTQPTLPEKGTGKAMKMTYDDPSLWADLSRDYNPIHLSSFAARLLGFPGKLAHGNHVAARALALVESGGDGVELELRRPTVLPADLEVCSVDGGLEVGMKGKVYVSIKWITT